MNRIVAVALVAVLVPTAAEAQTVVVQGGAEVRPPPVVINPVPNRPRYRRRPGPRLMAPMKIDLGWIGTSSEHGTVSGAELSVGIHLASLWPEPIGFDVGVGVFAGGMVTSKSESDVADDDLGYAGGYLEGGKVLSGGTFWRTWVSGRAEYFGSDSFGDRREGLGASGKLEAELYLSGIGIAPNGIFFGTYALGVFVEGGLRKFGGGVNTAQLGAGLTIRTPLVWGW